MTSTKENNISSPSPTGDTSANPNANGSVNRSSFDLFLFGMMLTAGGMQTTWNYGYQHGFWNNVIMLIIAFLGYLLLSLSIGELSSALPFSGGIYGHVRALVGSYAGVVNAFCDLIMNVLFMSTSTLALGRVTTHIDSDYPDIQPAVWIGAYAVVVFVQVYGRDMFWWVIWGLGIFRLVLILIYIFACIPGADLVHWAELDSHSSEINGLSGFRIMETAGPASWFFIGVQYISLGSSVCSNPREQVPKCTISSTVLLFLLAMSVLLLSVSHAPGKIVLKHAELPLVFGFSRIFDIPYHSASKLVIPDLFGSIYGFSFALSHQLEAVAKSGLLPSVFTKTSSYSGTPYVALLAAVAFSFILNLIVFFRDNVLEQFYRISTLCSYVVYVFVCLAHISLCTSFSSMTRSFSSPLGIGGSIACIVIFVFLFIGEIGFDSKNAVSPIVFSSILVVATAYYYGYFVSHQRFSEEEKKVMFKAYLIKANTENREKKRKHGATKSNSVSPLKPGKNSQSSSDSNHNSMSVDGAKRSNRVPTSSGHKVGPSEIV